MCASSRIRPKIGDDPELPRIHPRPLRSKGLTCLLPSNPNELHFLRIYGGLAAILVTVVATGALEYSSDQRRARRGLIASALPAVTFRPDGGQPQSHGQRRRLRRVGALQRTNRRAAGSFEAPEELDS